jgi:molecular chaperone GrpE
MTKRKDESRPRAQSGSEEGVAQASVAISAEEFAALSAQLAETQAKAQEYLDALQRERADFTNFRRRADLDRDQSGRWTSGETIKKFLPILDDLERALAHRPADTSWADGVDLVYRKFQALLEKEGITSIDAEGKPFDPNLHEAIMQEASDQHEPGTVIAVLQQGYMYGERVLRPALVKVAQ